MPTNTRLRYRICLAAAASRDSTLVPRLSIFLSDSSFLVRSGAAFALGQLPCQQSLELLREKIKSEDDPYVRQILVESLGQIGSATDLANCISDYSAAPEILLPALIQFFNRQITSPIALEYCVAIIERYRGTSARQAVQALCRVRDRNALQIYSQRLLTQLDTVEPVVRQKIASLLARLEFAQKTELSKQLLEDSDYLVRLEAAQAIGSLSEPTANLTLALQDTNSLVVASALASLPANYVFPPSLKSVLLQLYHCSSQQVRGTVVSCLAARGGLAQLQQLGMYPVPLTMQDYLAFGMTQHAQAADLQPLEQMAQANQPVIATPAFEGWLNLTKQLVQKREQPPARLKAVLQYGLKSGDPVKITLSVTALTDSLYDYHEFLPDLYAVFNYKQRVEYREAILAVLELIARICPGDGAAAVQALLDSPDAAIRTRALAILKDNYQLPTATMPPTIKRDVYWASLKMLSKYGLKPRVALVTTRGTIILQLDGYYAPFTAAAFLELVECGFYNGLNFHRVVPNFVIQGGDPRGDGWGGPSYLLRTEVVPLEFKAGSVGMARSDYDTEGSQFFITLTDQPHLNYRYTRFGEVIDGLNIARRIERGDKIVAVKILK